MSTPGEQLPVPQPPSAPSVADPPRAERLLGWFQQALGHELPNHFVAIQGLLNLLELEEAEHLGSGGRDYLRRINATAQKAQALVRTLAEIGRVGRNHPPAEHVPLAELFEEVTVEIKRLFPDRVIEYHFSVGVPLVTVSRRPLRQVLIQILRLAVQAAREVPVRVEVGSRAGEGATEIWVADNGPGLTTIQQQQLFEPFAGDLAAVAEKLSWILAREVVESWGGRLRVESEPQSGSSATLSIPG